MRTARIVAVGAARVDPAVEHRRAAGETSVGIAAAELMTTSPCVPDGVNANTLALRSLP